MSASSVNDDSLAPRVTVLNLQDWHRPVDDAERGVLDGITGPVLDIGCGPGRLVAELVARGVVAMGIDIAPLAAQLSDSRGAPVLGYSVFDRVPGEGRWPTALLFDGNIGIGGDPALLMCRVRDVLADDGVVIVEVEAPDVPSHRGRAELRIDADRVISIAWATLNAQDVSVSAPDWGYRVDRLQQVDERWFVWLASTGAADWVAIPEHP